jgi:hypothetical protein
LLNIRSAPADVAGMNRYNWASRKNVGNSRAAGDAQIDDTLESGLHRVMNSCDERASPRFSRWNCTIFVVFDRGLLNSEIVRDELERRRVEVIFRRFSSPGGFLHLWAKRCAQSMITLE